MNNNSIFYLGTNLFNGFDIKLPEETLVMITELSQQVGSPTYIKTPIFQKREHTTKMAHDGIGAGAVSTTTSCLLLLLTISEAVIGGVEVATGVGKGVLTEYTGTGGSVVTVEATLLDTLGVFIVVVDDEVI
jgi:hypothetical protein